ncbi:TIGR01459 family HAD-type hydrolase [Hyphomicrobium methylovorum]|uniref:TIGR01459 family HAD-type hydrolase n=1 Tax=Hyphomicrobium methylovorum TaxID=84 RepID=UPI0015E64337|nr:TIGR01459 family HAD-type hydrolase [Hyphomicrobium methylovorum]MBA2127660.1 TIGR01459 family HAD-type hydrolase [Hyphomicrobium methylovorum]
MQPPSNSALPTPPVIANAAELLSRYEVLFCDVWGVIHNGLIAYRDACEALEEFRRRGGTVVLVSNAPVPKQRVADMLDTRQVPRSAWDDIVSSGDIALAHVAERGFQALYCIGPQDRDQALFRALSARSVPLAEAEALICTGLNDDKTETPENYRAILEQALARKLPFICANPDLIVDVGGTYYYCAGAIADLYAEMGGAVYWAGKPHLNAYETAHAKAESLRDRNVEKRRILVIGDSLRTDMKGAETFGCDALFIASGIHRHETMDDAHLSPERLGALFDAQAPTAVGAMAQLRW